MFAYVCILNVIYLFERESKREQEQGEGQREKQTPAKQGARCGSRSEDPGLSSGPELKADA